MVVVLVVVLLALVVVVIVSLLILTALNTAPLLASISGCITVIFIAIITSLNCISFNKNE